MIAKGACGTRIERGLPDMYILLRQGIEGGVKVRESLGKTSREH